MDPTTWTYQYGSPVLDPELRTLDILIQVIDDVGLSNVQRWRMVDYLNDRYGRS